MPYPWQPHTSTPSPYVHGEIGIHSLQKTFATLAEAEKAKVSLTQFLIDFHLTPFINDVIHLSIENFLSHTTDVVTNSLATARIPSDANHHNTARFLIAFMHEKNLAYQTFLDGIQIVGSQGDFYVNFWSNRVFVFVAECSRKASKITEIMEDASAAIGTLAQNADFVRQAALIDLGEVVGLCMSTAGNTVKFGTPAETGDAGQMRVFHNLSPNTSFNITRLDEIRFPTRKENETDTLTITAKNGPSEISVRTLQGTTKTVLAKDASRTFSLAEMTSSVTSQPILLPKVETHLTNQTVQVDTQQTLTYTGTLSGIRLNYTVTSSDETVATVRLGETGVLVMSGIAAGTCNIRLSATNEAGTTVSEFQCTVTAQTQE